MDRHRGGGGFGDWASHAKKSARISSFFAPRTAAQLRRRLYFRMLLLAAAIIFIIYCLTEAGAYNSPGKKESNAAQTVSGKDLQGSEADPKTLMENEVGTPDSLKSSLDTRESALGISQANDTSSGGEATASFQTEAELEKFSGEQESAGSGTGVTDDSGTPTEADAGRVTAEEEADQEGTAEKDEADGRKESAGAEAGSEQHPEHSEDAAGDAEGDAAALPNSSTASSSTEKGEGEGDAMVMSQQRDGTDHMVTDEEEDGSSKAADTEEKGDSESTPKEKETLSVDREENEDDEEKSGDAASGLKEAATKGSREEETESEDEETPRTLASDKIAVSAGKTDSEEEATPNLSHKVLSDDESTDSGEEQPVNTKQEVANDAENEDEEDRTEAPKKGAGTAAAAASDEDEDDESEEKATSGVKDSEEEKVIARDTVLEEESEDADITPHLATETRSRAAEQATVSGANSEKKSFPEPVVDPSVNCTGRFIYMYPLPALFNKALLEQCSTLLPWYDMCPYFMNDGLGKKVRETGTLMPSGRWFETHQYTLGVIFHNKIRRSYPCLTLNPDKASLFYIPFFAALDAVRWQFAHDSTLEQRDRLSHYLVRWLSKRPHFTRHQGADHLLVVGRPTWDFRRKPNSDWGNVLLEQPALKKVTKLLLERNIWDSNDVGIPHPTHFHPKSDKDMFTWQKHVKGKKRNILASFAAFPESLSAVKEVLTIQCKEQPMFCRYMQCMEDVCSRPAAVMGLFVTSTFCIMPPGGSGVRRAVFEALIGGCIPVLFDDFNTAIQFPWHLPEDSTSYSVFAAVDKVKSGDINVVDMLKTIPNEKIKSMREYITLTLLPHLVYSHPRSTLSTFQDAFDIALEHMLEKVKTLRGPIKEVESLAAATRRRT